ncbi:MAG: zinc-dependent alcohol dehydrogenase family protein [Desulfurococcaceae archaeon]
MRAAVLREPAPVESRPLSIEEVQRPRPGAGEVLLRVLACGVCRTDLHIVEGELAPPKLPLIPGHQVVGIVEEAGEGVDPGLVGRRVGVPWLYYACGRCKYCRRGLENLCENALFTGYNVDGGYAEYMVAKADFVHEIPAPLGSVEAAPLLCAGAIGYRSLKLSGVLERPGSLLGLFGYGSAAHLVLQVARRLGARVYVFTTSPWKVEAALKAGAEWAGPPTSDPPEKLDAAIVYAPASTIFVEALKKVDRGGRVVLSEIYMSPIERLDYRLLWHEREVKSVANVTRADVREILGLASSLGVRPEVKAYELDEANEALMDLKRGRHVGQIVLTISS